jgi:hypothetical protein
MAWLVGTRNQARAAVREIERRLGIPRAQRDGSAPTSRWATPCQLAGGSWAFSIDTPRALLLSADLQALVVPSLPVLRRLNPALLGIGEFAALAPADLPDSLELLDPERWRPVVVRARFQHSALPALAGATTLYDGAGSVHDLGTQYTRADGLTWVVQPIVTLAAGARYVLALWVKIRGAASDEKALLDTITLALETQNDTVRTLECRNRDGVWVLKNGLTASDGPIATSWPAGWRLYVPGDVAGAPSGDACVLGQVV